MCKSVNTVSSLDTLGGDNDVDVVVCEDCGFATANDDETVNPTEPKSPKFKDDNGRLTEYSFACGYVENKTTCPLNYREKDLHTELYMEHAHYHVRQFDRRDGGMKRTMWETFSADEFAAARKLFDEQPGEIYDRG